MSENILGLAGIAAGLLAVLGIAAAIAWGVTTSRAADERERTACIEQGSSYVEAYNGPVCISGEAR